MHKDQKRVMEVVLPLIAVTIHDETPESERDCTVLNRLLSQGADPLFLMEAAPADFAALCKDLSLTVEEGREAIENAHWQGPGILLDGTGLPDDFMEQDSSEHVPLGWRQEALWLILAYCSDCVEDGYSEKITILERIQRATAAAIKVSDIVSQHHVHPYEIALQSLAEFKENTPVTMDERGFPHTTEDHGFYVLYKQGYQCAAVDTPSMTFWGTTPYTTLAEQGVAVDKEISPHFGIVFKSKE